MSSPTCYVWKTYFGGAQIEDITKRTENIKDKVEGHIMVKGGINNIKSDETQIKMNNYEDQFRKLKTKNKKRISMVLMLKRNAKSNYNDVLSL